MPAGRSWRPIPGAQRSSTDAGSTRRTTLVALVANLGVTIAKAVAAGLTGSAALLAETLHSLADVVNELMLLVGVRRSHRPPDSRHPRGYGRDRYFWSLLAAVGIFVAGGALSVLDGVDAVVHPRAVDHIAVGLGVLALSAVLEGYSWWTARRQLKAEAAEHDVGTDELIEMTSDPAPLTVALEDSAALVGLALAALGLTLHWLTDQAVWDGLASISVGFLLVAVAVRLIAFNRRLLLGRAVPEQLALQITEVVEDEPWTDFVSSAVIVYVGPGRVSASLDVVPHPQVATSEVVDGIDSVRSRLLAHDGIDAVALTLVRGRDDG